MQTNLLGLFLFVILLAPLYNGGLETVTESEHAGKALLLIQFACVQSLYQAGS